MSDNGEENDIEMDQEPVSQQQDDDGDTELNGELTQDTQLTQTTTQDEEEKQVIETLQQLVNDPELGVAQGTVRSLLQAISERLGWNAKPYKKLIKTKFTEFVQDTQEAFGGEEKEAEQKESETGTGKQHDDDESREGASKPNQRQTKSSGEESDDTDEEDDDEEDDSRSESDRKENKRAGGTGNTSSAKVSRRTTTDESEEEEDDDTDSNEGSEKPRQETTAFARKKKATTSRKTSAAGRRKKGAEEEETEHVLKGMGCMGEKALVADLRRTMLHQSLALQEVVPNRTVDRLCKLCAKLIALAGYDSPLEELSDNIQDQTKEIIKMIQIMLPMNNDVPVGSVLECIKYGHFLEILRNAYRTQILRKGQAITFSYLHKHSLYSLEPTDFTFHGEVSDYVDTQACLETDVKVTVDRVFDCISRDQPGTLAQFSLMRLAAKDLIDGWRNERSSGVLGPDTPLECAKWPLRWLWIAIPVSALPAFLMKGTSIFPRLRIADGIEENTGVAMWELCSSAWSTFPFTFSEEQPVALVLCEVFTGNAYSPSQTKDSENYHSILRYGENIVSPDTCRTLLRPSREKNYDSIKPEVDSVAALSVPQGFEQTTKENTEDVSEFLQSHADKTVLDGTMYGIRDTKQICPAAVAIVKISKTE
eukprot:gb/GECG01014929.1/.p1 GENE.gb/GECG01014929.1/~~gb/GECG01014929.1/.p1  ORF type:complete len:650 (+),score=126.59 gb/GECG01014929.1/:1-1950(+)